LFDKLVDHFGEDRIFMDVAYVEAGQDLAETIENAVDSCAIVIVIIGPRWLSERLNNPNDMVRLEITRALRRDIPVIPVLVQGAHMPYRQGLPHDLMGLTERQAIELSDHSWRANVNELISGIEQHLAKSEKAVWRDSDVPESDETRRTIQSYEQQLEVALQAGDRKSESLALHNLGAAYAELGEMRRAVEFFEQAFVIHREMGERLGESSALSNLGLAYANLGDTRRAIEYFEQALAINREMGERRGESSALINLGTAYTDLGEPRRAIEYFDQALQIHRELGDRVSEGSALSHLGITYADLGEPRHAVEFFQQALLIDRELGEPGSEGADLSNISMALAQMGDRFQAIKYAELALEIFEKIEDPKAAKVRAQLAAWRDQANT
jgi:tetratricopeptide (TPR) repeat protein